MGLEEIPVIEPGQEWEIDLFRPEDGEGVANLFRTVYGEGYPLRHFLEPDRLRQENAAGRVVSSVARTPRGEVVGHNALYRSAAWDGIAESGAGVVHPAYRGGKGIFTRLVRHGLEVGGARFGFQALFGEPVCNHVFSQKLMHSEDFRTGALEVDLMPADAYVKEGSASGRVAAFLGFRTVRSRPHAVYLPECYGETLRTLYAGIDDTRELRPAAGTLRLGVATQIEARFFDFAQVARLVVREEGSDFAEALRAEEEAARVRGGVVVQVWLKLSRPWVGEAVAALRRRGYFLGGILPRWFDDDGLLMQKVWGEPSWDGIQVHFDGDREILDLVRMDWESSRRQEEPLLPP